MNPRRAAAYTVLALAAVDAAETSWALTRPGGQYTEVSPLPALIGAQHGLAAMVLLGAAATCAIAGAFLLRPRWRSARGTLWAGAALLAGYKTWVVCWNALQLVAAG